MTLYTRWNSLLQEAIGSSKVLRIYHNGWDARIFKTDCIEELLNIDEGLNILKMTKNTQETKACLFRGGERVFFLKKIDFRQKKLETRFRYMFQPSRSYWAAYVAMRIAREGFLTPEVYAVGERRSCLLVSETFIVTEALMDAKGGHEEQRELGLNLGLLYEAGSFLYKFHSAGFFHGDMQLSNFYVQDKNIGIWDLDSVELFDHGVVPDNKKKKDLGRLFSSFVQLIDYLNRDVNIELNIVSYADALGQGYGIDRKYLIDDFNRVWRRTLRLRHEVIM